MGIYLITLEVRLSVKVNGGDNDFRQEKGGGLKPEASWRDTEAVELTLVAQACKLLKMEKYFITTVTIPALIPSAHTHCRLLTSVMHN